MSPAAQVLDQYRLVVRSARKRGGPCRTITRVRRRRFPTAQRERAGRLAAPAQYSGRPWPCGRASFCRAPWDGATKRWHTHLGTQRVPRSASGGGDSCATAATACWTSRGRARRARYRTRTSNASWSARSQETTPRGATHWSRESMARACGLSASTVGCVWRAFAAQSARRGDFQAAARLRCSDARTAAARSVAAMSRRSRHAAGAGHRSEPGDEKVRADPEARPLPRTGGAGRMPHACPGAPEKRTTALIGGLGGRPPGPPLSESPPLSGDSAWQVLSEAPLGGVQALPGHDRQGRAAGPRHPPCAATTELRHGTSLSTVMIHDWRPARRPRYRAALYGPTSTGSWPQVELWFAEITRQQIRRGTHRPHPSTRDGDQGVLGGLQRRSRLSSGPKTAAQPWNRWSVRPPFTYFRVGH